MRLSGVVLLPPHHYVRVTAYLSSHLVILGKVTQS